MSDQNDYLLQTSLANIHVNLTLGYPVQALLSTSSESTGIYKVKKCLQVYLLPIFFPHKK